MAAPAPIAIQRASAPAVSPAPVSPVTGQAASGQINPLGLFSITSNGTNTLAIQGQQFNPGDVPAPPVYGGGTGAPTNYTQTDFGGTAAPDMAATLNNPHPAILAAPAPIVKAPVTPTHTRGSALALQQSRQRAGIYVSPQEFMQRPYSGTFGLQDGGISSPYDQVPVSLNKTTSYAEVPNRAISKSSMVIPSNNLQYGNKT